MQKKRSSKRKPAQRRLVIPVIGGRTLVPLTGRERAEIPAQRELAAAERVRLRKAQIAAQIRALQEESEALDEPEVVEDVERAAIQDEGEGDWDFDMPDWESEEFWDEWADEVDYEIFTVLS
jgi:hypothetical protein